MNNRNMSYQVKLLANLLRRSIDQSGVMTHDDGITAAQGWIIAYLYQRSGEDVFQRDLYDQFHLRRSTVTGILKLMEKNGFIVREPVPKDARLKKLVLTPKAVEQYQRVMRRIDEIETRMMEGFTQEECEQALSYIRRMQKNLGGDCECSGTLGLCRPPRQGG